MKHLYDSLRTCAKEEEVKAEFCKFFRMKIFALRGIDRYAERVLSAPYANAGAFYAPTGGSQLAATEEADATSCVPPVEALRAAHDALRAELPPQIYSLGFLNPDVEYFK